jgi:adenylate cyclase
MKKMRFIPLLTFIGVVATVVLYYWQPAILEGFEARTYDWRVRAMRGAVKASPRIAIIAIDEKSIAELGRFPWTRERFAELLGVTSRAGAQGVLFDIIFPEAQDPRIDGEFAAAIRSAGNVTLPEVFEFAADGSVAGTTSNIPILQKAAARIAHINVFPDEDGVIRWTRLVVPHGGSNHLSLGMSGAAGLLGSGPITPGSREVSIGRRRIATDDEQRMLINYSGAPGGYELFSFVDVLKGRVAPDRLKGRVLFVGATALAVYDMRITPLSNNAPGVEVNANIADNIARGDFLRRDSAEALFDIAAIVLLGLVAAFVTLKVRHSASLPLVMLLIAGYGAVSAWMFQCGHWVSVVYPELGIILSFALTAYLRFFFFDSEAREIRSVFSSYVSKKVVDELVKNPELARIGGETRVITILFADVKNYTAYSEKRSPAEVVRILNDYLEAMTDLILKHDGTLDKFLGDGILAYWNAPLTQDNHAQLAVRCAHEMMQRMGPLQRKWLQQGDEPLAWGIGINTGEVIVGNIGAFGKKMEYTAIGDNVNLTYRIQNESRDLGCPVITRALYERVHGMVEAEPIGQVTVKGKQVPIDIFALRGIRQGGEGTWR